MIDEICREIKNFFVRDGDKHIGDFAIVGGVLTPEISFSGTQLIRIQGSAFNDGVWKPSDTLTDEQFHGGVWVMSPPQAFLDLCDDIKAWNDKYSNPDNAAMSPFNSESFGGYSYSKSAGYGGALQVGWQSVFGNRLNIYRKARLL